jgi:hypothetical protein
MFEPSLPELEAERDRLYAQLSAVGDFRRGSVSENYRKCGKPNCACARPDHPDHGPRFLWTRTARGRGTVGRQLAAGEVEKARREVARRAEFTAAVERIAASCPSNNAVDVTNRTGCLGTCRSLIWAHTLRAESV